MFGVICVRGKEWEKNAVDGDQIAVVALKGKGCGGVGV